MTDESHAIHVLVPDLPKANALTPLLERIDKTRRYANSGPLAQAFTQVAAALIPATQGANAPPHAVPVASGSAALELALRAHGLPPGAKVLMPALGFPAMASAALRCGLVPVFADISPGSWTLTTHMALDAVRAADIALVMPVAAYGHALPAEDWDEFYERTGIPVIMDAAGAFPWQAVGRNVCVAFSLHATKPFGIGEGGLVVTRDDVLAERVRRLADHGFSHGLVSEPGLNCKMSEFHAAVGLAQAGRIDGVLAELERVRIAYAERLAPLVGAVSLQRGGTPPRRSLLVMRLHAMAADDMAAALGRHGIQTRRWYCPPLTAHPAFRHVRLLGPDAVARLPVTDALGPTLLGLPYHTSLTDADVAEVCAVIERTIAESHPPGDRP
ncbi:dTDP-4-amino-4,6-dideoxygalactose transaminase [Desulfobaculum xiamenense]|uniref:dTDP-4-amino-4,6-dideoxygalactose transaminase n=1 Tax=Desulfobaculum xiamenense TaxID=995050 RepID=A0A846QT28_9BACT|nr:DegT/DnrJ/EryC1/StrS aminotransferase family protein [Desulfobaculum xiamenense]NJB69513.1 dTDP-4-amino-4,6-dideoxygalactose transaminase [Desulfobaculum xiamenense]